MRIISKIISALICGGILLFAISETKAQTATQNLGVYGRAQRGQLPGITNNTAATAGNIGQFFSSEITSGSAVTLTTDTAANVTSISPTAGEWLIGGNICFDLGGGTTMTQSIGNILTTTASISGMTPQNHARLAGFTTTGSVSMCYAIPTRAISLSGTTQHFLNAYASFATSTNKAYGWIWAVRTH